MPRGPRSAGLCGGYRRWEGWIRQLIPSHNFLPHNCNPKSKACKHPYLWTASQKLGLVSTAISLQHCLSLSCCSLATTLGLGWVQPILKVLHYIILTFDRTGNAWVFLDNPRVYLPHTKAKWKKYAGNTWQTAAHSAIAYHMGGKKKTLRFGVVSKHRNINLSVGTLSNNGNALATQN